MSLLEQSLSAIESLGVKPQQFDSRGFLPFENVETLLTPSWEKLGSSFMGGVADAITSIDDKTLNSIMTAVGASHPIAAAVVTVTKQVLEYYKRVKQNTKVVSTIRRSQKIQELVDKVSIHDMYGRYTLPRFTYVTPKGECRRRLVLPAQTVPAVWELDAWPSNYKPTGNVKDGLDVYCDGGDGDRKKAGAKGSRPWGYISLSALTYPLCIGTRPPLILPGIPPDLSYELFSGGKIQGEDHVTKLINPNAKLIALQAAVSMDPFANAKVNIQRVFNARKALAKHEFTGYTAKEGEGQTINVSRGEIQAALAACDAVLQCRASLLNSKNALENLTRATKEEQRAYSQGIKQVLESEGITPRGSLGASSNPERGSTATEQKEGGGAGVALLGLAVAGGIYLATRK